MPWSALDMLPFKTIQRTDTNQKLGDEAGGLRDDVMSALLNLGYHRALVERAVAEVMTKSTGDFEETLRQALRDLAK